MESLRVGRTVPQVTELLQKPNLVVSRLALIVPSHVIFTTEDGVTSLLVPDTSSSLLSGRLPRILSRSAMSSR